MCTGNAQIPYHHIHPINIINQQRHEEGKLQHWEEGSRPCCTQGSIYPGKQPRQPHAPKGATRLYRRVKPRHSPRCGRAGGQGEAAGIPPQVSDAPAGPHRGSPASPALPSTGGTGGAAAGQSPSPAAHLPRRPPPPSLAGAAVAGAGAAAPRLSQLGLTSAGSSSSGGSSRRQGRGSRLMVAESAPRCAHGRSARRRRPRRHGRAEPRTARRPGPPPRPALREAGGRSRGGSPARGGVRGRTGQRPPESRAGQFCAPPLLAAFRRPLARGLNGRLAAGGGAAAGASPPSPLPLSLPASDIPPAKPGRARKWLPPKVSRSPSASAEGAAPWGAPHRPPGPGKVLGGGRSQEGQG